LGPSVCSAKRQLGCVKPIWESRASPFYRFSCGEGARPDNTKLSRRLCPTPGAPVDALKGAVARHVDRFAFREAPLAFDWQDTPNG
jgi:hypothetical protein